MSEISAEEIRSLKGKGFLLCKDGTFAARIVTENGVLSAEKLRVLAEAAERFGNGKAALTIRMSVELQGIRQEKLAPLAAFLSEHGLSAGGTGPKIRPVVCCKGTVCPHGLIDTQGLAARLYREYYLKLHDTVLPSKFKIAVGGCPNNCIKPQIHDFGIVGAKPFSAEEPGCRIYLGGLWGRKQRTGDLLPGIYTEAQVLEILNRSLECWKAEGKAGERFGLFVERMGTEAVLGKTEGNVPQ